MADWWDAPEDDDEGVDVPTLSSSQGCTNNSIKPCNCIAVTGSGLHVASVVVTAKSYAPPLAGRWRFDRNGKLFVRSSATTLQPGEHSHEWNWNHEGRNFEDGDVLCGGFMLTGGTWHDSGCAAETVHA